MLRPRAGRAGDGIKCPGQVQKQRGPAGRHDIRSGLYIQPAPASSLHNVGNQVWASAATSDAFAWNVVAAWDGTPGVKYVYSPVTGQTYAMTYQVIGTGVGSVIATGGNGAYVQF